MIRRDSSPLSFNARSGLLAALLLALASCAPTIVPPAPVPPARPEPVPPEPPPPEPSSAIEAGVRPGPSLLGLLSRAEAEQALEAFKLSCPDLVRRPDVSGLTRSQDWQPICAAASAWPPAEAFQFFTSHFETAIVGDGTGFATGYFEPEIRGSRTRRPGYDVPVYAKPPDLLDANPRTGERGRGRVDANGNYVLYYERAEIEDGALAGRGLEIAWAADPVELFFLQIQGSGRLRLPDGGVMRIGYAGQNGREYVAIGRRLRERGIMESGITMQRIVEWLRTNPEEGRALMRENKSYIFFTELTGPGPLGSLGRALTPRVSIAADPRFVPLGVPVLLSGMDMPIANGFWIAQDTGGAIKGANRFDTFWGAGDQAARIAGGMSARGRALLLLPRGTVARIAEGAQAQR